MIPDPTDEIKAIRDRLFAECGYDLHRIVEETRRQERESGLVYLTSIEPAQESHDLHPQSPSVDAKQ